MFATFTMAMITIGACRGGSSAAPTSVTVTTTSSSVAATTAPTTDAAGAPIPVDASPEAASILQAFVDLGYCDSEWTSDLETAAQQVPEGAPLPQEAWSCLAGDTSVGMTRWNDDAEVQSFFAVATGQDDVADADFSLYSALHVDGGIVIGAFDGAQGTSDDELLDLMRQRVGGEIATYAELAR